MKRREFFKPIAAVGALVPEFGVRADEMSAMSGVFVAGTYDLVFAGASATGVCAAVTARHDVAQFHTTGGAKAVRI